MKAFVTGAAGFIGSHICERLLKENYEVTGLDCFTDYYPKTIKKNNLRSLNKEKKFTFLEANILNIDLKRRLAGTDYLFHFAAQAGVRASWGQDFKVYTDNNITAVQHILEAVALVFDGACGHDGRDCAGVGGEQRDEGFAVESGGAHDAVCNERGACEVAGVL